ncbi:MAG TPA: hypothetical protein DCS43_13400 [Verrucomicrobia bacterium]|nr:hypothetical protein [Verrucomicrobiota bacterium]
MNGGAAGEVKRIAWQRIASVIAPVGVMAVAFIVYMGNGRGWPSGDTIPNKLLPISILQEGDLDLDEFVAQIPQGKRYSMVTVNGRTYSSYPLGTAFTALPVYAVAGCVIPGLYAERMAPFHALGQGFGNERRTVASTLEKLSAALVAACSVLFVWLIARSRADVYTALLVTGAYAFGTSVMSSASQALWTHTGSCLALTAMLYLTTRPGVHATGLLIAGACAGWAFFCRPTNVLALAVFGFWVLVNRRQRALWWALGAAVVTLLAMLLNNVLYGHILGGGSARAGRLGGFSLEALLGVLFSPSRGLLVFSPYLALALLGGIVVNRRTPWRWEGGCLAAAMIYILLYACWPDWGGGYSLGPRLLCDVVPLLVLPFLSVCVSLPSAWRWRVPCVLAVALSVAVHAMGAYRGDQGWNGRIYRKQEVSALWQVRNSQWRWILFGRQRPRD